MFQNRQVPVRRLPLVCFISCLVVVLVLAAPLRAQQPNPVNFGIDRLDKPNLHDFGPNTHDGMDGLFDWTADGVDVTIYMIDLGVLINHREFTQNTGPRASLATSSAGVA